MSNNQPGETDNQLLRPILNYLLEKRGVDFSGYHLSMLERRIHQRMAAIACKNFAAYFSLLHDDQTELDCLLDVLTINVSRFFRDTLTFELIADRILPSLISEKMRTHDLSLRIWSAGCARGEEPYSLAILFQELLRKEEVAMNLHLFATDIDEAALAYAREALYATSSVENTKHRLLAKYFTAEGSDFRLNPEIKKLVTFTRYDILDKKRSIPPESIFGHFDLVLCRNLLIYFTIESQELIFDKLYQSLVKGGYLILGEAEAPIMNYRYHFKRVFDFSQVYRKI